MARFDLTLTLARPLDSVWIKVSFETAADQIQQSTGLIGHLVHSCTTFNSEGDSFWGLIKPGLTPMAVANRTKFFYENTFIGKIAHIVDNTGDTHGIATQRRLNQHPQN